MFLRVVAADRLEGAPRVFSLSQQNRCLVKLSKVRNEVHVRNCGLQPKVVRVRLVVKIALIHRGDLLQRILKELGQIVVCLCLLRPLLLLGCLGHFLELLPAFPPFNVVSLESAFQVITWQRLNRQHSIYGLEDLVGGGFVIKRHFVGWFLPRHNEVSLVCRPVFLIVTLLASATARIQQGVRHFEVGNLRPRRRVPLA